MSTIPKDLNERVSQSISCFWITRTTQLAKQQISGKTDQGARSAVTGGAQMDGFVILIEELVKSVEVKNLKVFRKKTLELPGFFRPTKQWDLLVTSEDQLLAVVEAKSQVGPSFGNNFNNRTEEAMGSALDLWTAYREGAFLNSPKPWLGYLFLLEDCDKSNCKVKVQEPHFPVFNEFKNASYAKRYEFFCRKLVRERHYCSAAFIMSKAEDGPSGIYSEPAIDLSFDKFARSLIAHLGAYAND